MKDDSAESACQKIQRHAIEDDHIERIYAHAGIAQRVQSVQQFVKCCGAIHKESLPRKLRGRAPEKKVQKFQKVQKFHPSGRAKIKTTKRLAKISEKQKGVQVR